MSVPTELRSFDKRCVRSQSLIRQYPDRVPVIVKSSLLPTTKFLVSFDLTVSGLMVAMRQKLKINESQAFYLCANDKILSGSQSIGEIFNSNKDKDGFLYLNHCTENVFG